MKASRIASGMTFRTLGVAGLSLALVSCAGLIPIVAPMVAKLGKNIINAATNSYSPEYKDLVTDMMGALEERLPSAEQLASMGSAAGVESSPGSSPVTPVTPVTTGPAGSVPEGPAPGGAAPPTPTAPAVASSLPPLEVEFDILKEKVVDGNTSIAIPVMDGEILHDGGGDPNSGDNYKIVVRPKSDCYVYLVQVDATGWVQPIFPMGFAAGPNPVSAGTTYQFPEGAYWLHLDQCKGTEWIYLLASRERQERLEGALMKLNEIANAGRPDPISESRVEPPSEEELEVSRRGALPPRKGGVVTVTSSDGIPLEVHPKAFLATASDMDVFVGRWFRHE